MVRPVRIAHITDLHCDAEDWGSVCFDPVVRCLDGCQPDIVVITGDLVETPSAPNFERLIAGLGEMHDTLQRSRASAGLASTCYILAIPGNHDIFDYGMGATALWNMSLKSLFARGQSTARAMQRAIYNEYKDQLCFPIDSGGVDGVRNGIFRDYGMAFFDLDSVPRDPGIGLARGRVDQPDVRLKDLSDRFKSLVPPLGVDYASALKIILMHHHPLPVLAKADQRKMKSGIIDLALALDDPLPVLDAASEFGIDLILHGHKHLSGEYGYQSMTKGAWPIIVSSCASSAKRSLRQDPGKEWEVRILDLLGTGDCVLIHYLRSSGDFPERGSGPLPVLSYADRRRRFVQRQKSTALHIDRANRRSKNVVITSEGAGKISITVEGLAWKPGAGGSLFATEHFRGDAGRVRLANYRFISGNKFWQRGRLNPAPITRPGNALPDGDESFSADLVVPGAINPREVASYRLDYYLHNGFMLNSSEHRECYARWGNPASLEEAVAIQTEYPTDLLELTVRFPDFGSFPDPDTIQVLAFRPADSPGFDVLRGVYTIHPQETEYLRGCCNALWVRSEVNEVSLRIGQPRIDMIYVVRWQVPQVDRAGSNLSLEDREFHDLLRRDFLDGRSDRRGNFFQTIAKVMENKFEGAETFLFGWDRGSCLLKVTARPERWMAAETRPLLVGRGVAGKSFRWRDAFVWDGDFDETSVNPSFTAHTEQVVVGLEPVAAVAIPLYPPSRVADNKVVEGGEVCREPFAVLSVVSCQAGSALHKLVGGGGGLDGSARDAFKQVAGEVIDAKLRELYGR